MALDVVLSHIKDGWVKYGYLLLLGGGVAGLALVKSGMLTLADYPRLTPFVETSSTAILGGGFFAFILKSFQLHGVYKKELEEIVTGYDFLSRRTDIEDIWRKASKALYRNKFPEVGGKVESIILGAYFPGEHGFYYSDFVLESEIEYLEGSSDFVQVTDYSSFKVNSFDSNALAKHYSVALKRAPGCALTNFELVSVEISDPQTKVKEPCTLPEPVDNGSTPESLKRKFTLHLSGRQSYQVDMVMRKTYSTKSDPTKSFTVGYITDGLAIRVKHPPGMNLLFFPSGAVNEYVDKSKPKESLIKKTYSGILLPKQGFRFIYR